MRIVIFCDCFDVMGGVERVVALWANHWRRQGHQVTLLTFYKNDDGPAYSLDDGVELTSLGYSKANGRLTHLWSFLTRMPRLAKVGARSTSTASRVRQPTGTQMFEGTKL